MSGIQAAMLNDLTHDNRELREALAASEQRNRELTARLDAAEKLVAEWRKDVHDRHAGSATAGTAAIAARAQLACATELEAAISPTPAQPAAGEER